MARTTDWNANLYDAAAHFVTDYGTAIVDLLAPKPGERILDVGCGTGHLTKQIQDAGAKVVGLDPSPNMIVTARETYPDIEFVEADITAYETDEPFDAIFSNAALHWVTNAEGAMKAMSKALKPGGRFVIEMGGHGNISKLITALFEALKQFDCYDPSHRWYFPSIGEYASLLERYEIEPTTVWLFDRLTKLEGQNAIQDWFTIFGEAIHADVSEDCFAEAVAIAQESLKPELYRDGVWYADYRRLRVVGQKLGGS